MTRQIRIEFETLAVCGELDDSETARAIWEALPLEATVNRWGDEIYFHIPVPIARAGNARELMSAGEMGYWPADPAFCIFFGPTPASRDERPRAASPVNPFGSVTADPAQLRTVRTGERVRVVSA